MRRSIILWFSVCVDTNCVGTAFTQTIRWLLNQMDLQEWYIHKAGEMEILRGVTRIGMETEPHIYAVLPPLSSCTSGRLDPCGSSQLSTLVGFMGL